MLETRLKLARFALTITSLLFWRPKKDVTIIKRFIQAYLIGSPLALITTHIRCSIVSTSCSKSPDLVSPSAAFIFQQYPVLMMGESDHCTSSTCQRFSMGLRSQLCGGQSMCEMDGSCSPNHFHDLSPVDSGVIILEPARAIGGRTKMMD